MPECIAILLGMHQMTKPPGTRTYTGLDTNLLLTRIHISLETDLLLTRILTRLGHQSAARTLLLLDWLHILSCRGRRCCKVPHITLGLATTLHLF
jgi:hypothetical protein